jgi:hypothetical protein
VRLGRNPDETAGPLGEYFSATEVVYLGQSLADERSANGYDTA